jgi:hypothetical protein
LARLSIESLATHLPTVLHLLYQGHKKIVEKAAALAVSAALTKEKIRRMKAEQKEREEKATKKREQKARVATFTGKIKAVANQLGVQWKIMCGQEFVKKLLRFCEGGDHSDEGTTCLACPPPTTVSHIRTACCPVQT